jgi:hypothetical protein
MGGRTEVPQKSSKVNCLPPITMIPFWVPAFEAETEFHRLELASGSGGPGGKGCGLSATLERVEDTNEGPVMFMNVSPLRLYAFKLFIAATAELLRRSQQIVSAINMLHFLVCFCYNLVPWAKIMPPGVFIR